MKRIKESFRKHWIEVDSNVNYLEEDENFLHVKPAAIFME
jgi:hypothetical protein